MGWYDGKVLTPAKIGTVPCVIWIHGRDKRYMAPGKRIRIKEREGDHWHHVTVTAVNPDGHVFADRL